MQEEGAGAMLGGMEEHGAIITREHHSIHKNGKIGKAQDSAKCHKM